MKRMILMAIAVLIVTTAAQAQIVYGDKTGWTAYTTEDEYSGKKSHYLRYFDQQHRLAASFFPGACRMAVLEWYDGVLYMDVTQDAVTERRGHIADREIDYEVRVTLPRNESAEGEGTVKMTFGDVERAGDTFFGTFVFDADVPAMKEGSTMAVRWYDPIKEKTLVKKISLQGFTRSLNEVLRRYGVKVTK